MERDPYAGDEHVTRLARLFREHPAWVQAAARLEPAATSAVFFSHRPGETWHLERREGETLLLPAAPRDADFAFRFTPAAVERLAAVQGDSGEFAVALFRLMGEEDERLRIGFRVRAPFFRLVRRGYLGLLASGGAPVLAYGASHGIRTLATLRRLVEESVRGQPEPWEVDLVGDASAGVSSGLSTRGGR